MGALHGSNETSAPTPAPSPTPEPSSAPTAAPAPSCPKKPSFCRKKCNGSQTCTRKLSKQCERKGCAGCTCSKSPPTSSPPPAPAPSCPKKPSFCRSKCNGSQTCSKKLKKKCKSRGCTGCSCTDSRRLSAAILV